jgi:hypothetical protein
MSDLPPMGHGDILETACIVVESRDKEKIAEKKAKEKSVRDIMLLCRDDVATPRL